MKKATAIIQARMGSSRLPGKVLMPLVGKTVLEHVIRRCQHAKSIDRVIVATTVDLKDLAVANLVSGLNVSIFCGSINDVLDRYYQAARLFSCKHIVRITADCPMIDPDIIDRVVCEFFNSGSDYAANTLEQSYPDGEDVEVFGFDILSQAQDDAKMLSEREHVTPYIRKNSIYKKINIANKIDLSRHRWTLDESQDYQKLSAVFDALYKKDPMFHIGDILRFLDAHPRINMLNKDIARNEGYQKSLVNDRKAF